MTGELRLREIEERTVTCRAELGEGLSSSANAITRVSDAAGETIEHSRGVVADQRRARDGRGLSEAFAALDSSARALSRETGSSAHELADTAARIAEGAREIGERMVTFEQVSRSAKLLAVNAMVRSLRLKEGAVLRQVVEQIEEVTRAVSSQASRLLELSEACTAEVAPLEAVVGRIASRASALESEGLARRRELLDTVGRVEASLDAILTESRASSERILELGRGASRALSLHDDVNRSFDRLAALDGRLAELLEETG